MSRRICKLLTQCVMLISIIIPLYNQLSLTRNCLSSLYATLSGVPHEIILVDDGSTDGTRKFLEDLPSLRYKIILNRERQGFARNNNIGAHAASGDILCLLNNDTIAHRGWIYPMLDVLHEYPNAGAVGNVHWNPKTGFYDHMGMIVGANAIPEHFGRHWPFVPFSGAVEWKTVTAACWLLKKKVFEESGGFSDNYHNGCEDVDWCLRMLARGYRHYVASGSVISHLVSSSEGRQAKTRENEKRLLQEWGDELRRLRDRREIRLSAVNYIGRFAVRPWKYNGPKLLRAVTELLSDE